MRHGSLALLLLLAPALGTAGGSSSPPSSKAKPASAPDVFLGYTYTRAGEAGLHGWQLSGSYPLGRSLRLVADLSGHYGSFAQADLSQLTFLAGARWAWSKSQVTPFAEALIGGARTKTSVALAGASISGSDTDWGAAFGGGVDYRFAGSWAARAQVDLLLLRAEGAWESDPRISLGVVYRLGR
jgi:opacity protein-like surface antigen